MSSWICDGKPKNTKYSGAGELHAPHENHSPDCDLCSLPKEAVMERKDPPPLKLIIAGAIALFLVAVGGVFASSLFKGDRHLKTYQLAMTNGDRALSIVRNHSSQAELEEAQSKLTLAITQLNKIPVDASVYIDANKKINNFDSLSLQIGNKLNNFDLCGIEPKPDSCLF